MSHFYKIYLLLSIWLFALAGPAIITIFDNDAKIVLTNLNEEEQQEQHKLKKVKEIEKYMSSDFSYLSYSIEQKNLSFVDRSSLNNSQYFAKIIVPPPEHTL